MKIVPHVKTVVAHLLKLPAPFTSLIAIDAIGEVPTTGWTHIRLSPRFYIVDPPNGFWDFDLLGDEPNGIVGQVVLPVHAHTVIQSPRWCKGIRVHAKTNSVESKIQDISLSQVAPEIAITDLRKSIVQQSLASYDDSFQPTGATKFDPWPHAQFKKLHHDLLLTVDGPDEGRIRVCINQAIAAGFVAAIVAALGTGGAALPAAISAFLAALEGCLGASFSAKVDDHSHWEYWWT